MTDEDPTLKDIWCLLGTLNERLSDRFDGIDGYFSDSFDPLEPRAVSLEERTLRARANH